LSNYFIAMRVDHRSVTAMNRSRLLRLLAIPLIFLAATSAQQRPVSKSAQSPADEFAAEMQKLRDTWVQEFNAGHADKLAALYAPEAVLMRWDGSVHVTESILAEFNRSISGGAHDYGVHSLHAEHSGDLGYDTGAYNVSLRDRLVEGNYLVVVKRLNGRWKIVAHSSVANPGEAP
jgi:hypothetical protein